jgi:hypothetical protein
MLQSISSPALQGTQGSLGLGDDIHLDSLMACSMAEDIEIQAKPEEEKQPTLSYTEAHEILRKKFIKTVDDFDRFTLGDQRLLKECLGDPGRLFTLLTNILLMYCS